MNVETILRAKGRDVATIEPDATVESAIRLLASRRIGALIVSEDGRRVDGIVSERDIVQGLAEHGAGLLEQRIEDVMTRRVHTCSPEDTVEELMGRMTERRIRHLPVVEAGALCGMVSIGDVVKNRIEEVEYEASSLRSYVAG